MKELERRLKCTNLRDNKRKVIIGANNSYSMHYDIKKILPFIILILYVGFAIAGSADVVYDTGVVSLNIVNRPPVITDIHFDPQIVFEDSKLECIASINDEKPDEIRFIYRWYLNGKLVEMSDGHFTGFNENDVVKCEVTPIDNENAVGETKSASTIVNKISTLSAFTGFIVKNYNMDLTTIFNFFF